MIIKQDLNKTKKGVLSLSIFFTSDTHFFHKNILKFEDRPYSNIEEMNEGIIQNWNKVVKNNDIVYYLGDFSLGTVKNAIDILQQLKGKIILIRGNHDHSKHIKQIIKLGLLHNFYDVGLKIKYSGNELWLTHFPMEIGIRPKKWSVHGHIHSQKSKYLNQINVGVDSLDFPNRPFGEPIEIDDLYEIMTKRENQIKEIFLKSRIGG